jgi:hypothetical protein
MKNLERERRKRKKAGRKREREGHVLIERRIKWRCLGLCLCPS